MLAKWLIEWMKKLHREDDPICILGDGQELARVASKRDQGN